MLKKHDLLLRQEEGDQEVQIVAYADKAADVELIFELVNRHLSKLDLPTLTTYFLEVAEGTSELDLYFGRQRELFKNIRYVALVQSLDLLASCESLIQIVRVFLLQVVALDRQILKEGPIQHPLGKEAKKEGGEHDDGSVEASDVTNHDHDGVEGPLVAKLLRGKVDRDFCLRCRISLVLNENLSRVRLALEQTGLDSVSLSGNLKDHIFAPLRSLKVSASTDLLLTSTFEIAFETDFIVVLC